MSFEPLNEHDVATLRSALTGCADELMSTPPDGLRVEYARELEMIENAAGIWPEQDIVGRDLINAGDRLEAGTSRLPEAVPVILRPIVASALRFDAAAADGGEPDHRALHLAMQTVAETARIDARRWPGGWELNVLGSSDLVTQVGDLAHAPAMARDLMETWFPGADFSRVHFEVNPIE